jgi:hypothetical protein
MSFIHWTDVGHFDLVQFSARTDAPSRPIDLDLVNRLLAEYPSEVAGRVEIQNGRARCHWAPAPREVGRSVYEFAYRLAQQAGCMAVENGRRVGYPPEAVQEQDEALPQLHAQSAAPQ